MRTAVLVLALVACSSKSKSIVEDYRARLELLEKTLEELHGPLDKAELPTIPAAKLDPPFHPHEGGNVVILMSYDVIDTVAFRQFGLDKKPTGPLGGGGGDLAMALPWLHSQSKRGQRARAKR